MQIISYFFDSNSSHDRLSMWSGILIQGSPVCKGGFESSWSWSIASLFGYFLEVLDVLRGFRLLLILTNKGVDESIDIEAGVNSLQFYRGLHNKYIIKVLKLTSIALIIPWVSLINYKWKLKAFTRFTFLTSSSRPLDFITKAPTISQHKSSLVDKNKKFWPTLWRFGKKNLWLLIVFVWVLLFHRVLRIQRHVLTTVPRRLNKKLRF